ncbi:UNVERIFIED_CONTAM: Calmodulin-binding transcription activator 3 [Sesamum angustifolium]|uniref:Calmodulin-binding transcription activator 3 n=1 Tax=Sesamum angustifolium TaxID=2727405 RepID=A0AAW2JEN5_9LAMI
MPRPKAIGAGISIVDVERKEDDYDFLKLGREQTEDRLQKVVARLKSMVQYLEARDQYCKWLSCVSEMQETKAVYVKVSNNYEVDCDADLIDLEALLDDDGGKGPDVLDEVRWQGVLHFAAALGYNWAIPLALAARVSANFRDADGCTTLSGQHSHTEDSVLLLVQYFFSSTPPTYPAGRPPAELVANNGHKAIAGYLSNSLLSSLSSHISLLNLEDSNEDNDRRKPMEIATGWIATPAGCGDLPMGCP